MEGAWLNFAILSGMNLNNFDFTKAELRYANLDFTDLQNAILNNSDMKGASLYQVDLSGT